MEQTLIITVLAALATTAVSAAFEPGGLLEFWGNFLSRLHLNPRFGKLASPLGLCIWCFGLWFSLGFTALLWLAGAEVPTFAWVAVPLASPTLAAIADRATRHNGSQA